LKNVKYLTNFYFCVIEEYNGEKNKSCRWEKRYDIL